MSGDLVDDVFGDIFPGKRPLRDVGKVPTKTKHVVVDDEWDKHPTVKMLRGVRTEFFTVGDLAAALGRTPVTIRSWEDKGWLPHATFRTETPKGTQVPGKKVKGRRLYTRSQIEVVLAAAAKHGVMENGGKNARWKAFCREVLVGWQQLS